MKHPLFDQLEFNVSDSTLLSQACLKFDNGYTASAAIVENVYGNSLNPYEFTVLKNGELCYGTPVTDFVVKYCDKGCIETLLHQIKALPKLKTINET